MPSKLLAPLLVAALLAPGIARAHCDTLDGPVVNAARAALDTGKLEPVLAWVQPGDEAEIREAFLRSRAVRAAGGEAKALADRWFFETVVRVHRAGEGAPFTGLKPAGTPDPAVAATDRAIASGDPKPLEALLVGAVRRGLHEGFAALKAERPPAADVAAGRRWVAAYVPLVHWAEAVHAAAAPPTGHGEGHAAHGAKPVQPDVAKHASERARAEPQPAAAAKGAHGHH
jgi:hypothetical protein